MADQNQANSTPQEAPQLTPGEKVDRLAEAQRILLAMVENKELPEDALKKLASKQAVGLTPEQEKQNKRETAELTLEFLVDQILNENSGVLGGQDDPKLRKYLMPKLQEIIIAASPIGESHDEFKRFIYKSIKELIKDYAKNGPDQKLEHWYAGVNAHELIHHTLRNCEEFTGRSFESYNLGSRDEEGIVSEAFKAIHEKDPKSREEADVIMRDVISKRLDVFADLAATLNYVASKQSGVVDTHETVKEKRPVSRKYSRCAMIAAGGIAAAYLAIAGGAHIGYKLEEWLNAPSKVAVSENTTNLENRVNDISNVPENITAQNPVNEAVGDYNENAPVPEEVKPAAVPAAHANQVNQETPLPDIYVPAPAVPKEMHKEISKETFEAMYVLAKTKIEEEIDNYAGLWNRFFQHAQTPAQIIPEITAQTQEQTQEQIPQVPESHRVHAKKTARTNAAEYLITPYLGEKFALHSEKDIGPCTVLGVQVSNPHGKTSPYGGIEYSQTKDRFSDSTINVELESSQLTGKIGLKHNLSYEKDIIVSANLAAKLIYESNLMSIQTGGITTDSRDSRAILGLELGANVYYNLGKNLSLFVEGAIGKNFGKDVNTDLETVVRIGLTKKY